MKLPTLALRIGDHGAMHDGSELTVWVEAAALIGIADAAIVALRARGLHPQALCPTGACETCCPTEAADNT